jgi:integrase
MPCTIKLVKVSEAEALFYESDVLDRLVTAAEKVSTGALGMVLLGADAGLRRGEIVGLEWTDIDFKRGQICVQMRIPDGLGHRFRKHLGADSGALGR